MHPRYGQQHARCVRSLFAEREILAQAGARREPRRGHPAARIVAIDQLDDVEHVRAIALAVHHEEVGERERGVTEDVRPDLRQLRVDGSRAVHGGVEDAEQLSSALGGGLAGSAHDAGERVDLLDEPPTDDPLRTVNDEDVLVRTKATALLDVTRDELRRSGGHGRAEHDGMSWIQRRHEVVQRRADIPHVDFDVRERRRAQRQHDVAGPCCVGHGVRDLEVA